MRRKKRAEVYDLTHDIYETVSVDRRQFLNRLGIAVLTVQCLSANGLDSEDWHRGTTGAPDDLLIHSSPGAFSHEHDLLIPMAVIKTPPRQGVQLTSSKALLHRHPISLTQKELTTVSQGGTVIQKASSHVFVIALAKQSQPRP
jgi:hypothetical protein